MLTPDILDDLTAAFADPGVTPAPWSAPAPEPPAGSVNIAGPVCTCTTKSPLDLCRRCEFVAEWVGLADARLMLLLRNYGEAVLADHARLQRLVAQAANTVGVHRGCGGDVTIADSGSGALICERCQVQDWMESCGPYDPDLLDHLETLEVVRAERDALRAQLSTQQALPLPAAP